MDYIYKYGNKKYYKAFCSVCNSDRGYVQKRYIIGLCSSCGAKKRCIDHCNPMSGKKHINRERFRKNTFDNVDYYDIKVEYSSAGNKRTKYRQVCPKCRVDVGYRVHFDAKRLCKACRDIEATKYTLEQKRIRSSMKANLVARLKKRLLNKNKKSTFDVLEYTVDDLKNHLESKWQPGMSWENYGKWEIDHITPDSWFKYNSTEDEDFKKSWSLENLQPLWKTDNASKSNRYEG